MHLVSDEGVTDSNLVYQFHQICFFAVPKPAQSLWIPISITGIKTSEKGAGHPTWLYWDEKQKFAQIGWEKAIQQSLMNLTCFRSLIKLHKNCRSFLVNVERSLFVTQKKIPKFEIPGYLMNMVSMFKMVIHKIGLDIQHPAWFVWFLLSLYKLYCIT